jgi:hypothetical protein
MTSSAATAGAPKTPSVWEDFVDIFTSPSQVFARRENGGWVLPLIVITVIVTIIFVGTRSLTQPLFDAMFDQQAAIAMQKNPQLTQDQLASMRSMQEKLSPLFIFIGFPISVIVVAFVEWFVGKLFDAKQTLNAAFVVATYAFVPRIFQSVAGAVLAYLRDPSSLTNPGTISLGLGALLPSSASPLAFALATRVDLFIIWSTILLAIGLHVTGKIPKSKAYMAAVVIWLLGALPGVLGALRQM